MTMITATYEIYSSWDLDELGIDKDKITEYYVKWNRLYVTTIDEDGDEIETQYQPTSDGTDDCQAFKRPSNTIDNFTEA